MNNSNNPSRAIAKVSALLRKEERGGRPDDVIQWLLGQLAPGLGMGLQGPLGRIGGIGEPRMVDISVEGMTPLLESETTGAGKSLTSGDTQTAVPKPSGTQAPEATGGYSISGSPQIGAEGTIGASHTEWEEEDLTFYGTSPHRDKVDVPRGFPHRCLTEDEVYLKRMDDFMNNRCILDDAFGLEDFEEAVPTWPGYSNKDIVKEIGRPEGVIPIPLVRQQQEESERAYEIQQRLAHTHEPEYGTACAHKPEHGTACAHKPEHGTACAHEPEHGTARIQEPEHRSTSGHDPEAGNAVAPPSIPSSAEPGVPGGPIGPTGPGVGKPSPKQKPDYMSVVNACQSSGMAVFKDQSGVPHAAISMSGKRWIVEIDSETFRSWVTLQAAALGSGGQTYVKQVCQYFSAWAEIYGQEIHLYIRTADLDGAFWLDLDGQRAVRIVPGKWEVVKDPPILFRTMKTQKPLPVPIGDDDPRRVLSYFNLKSNDDELLLLTYLVTLLVPDITMAALVLHGEANSGKTTAMKMIKELVDPAEPSVFSCGTSVRELQHVAVNSRLLMLDNLEKLSPSVSAELCRIVTGSGTTRPGSRMFAPVSYRAAVGMCGIDQVASSPDLADRCLTFELGSFNESGTQRTEDSLWKEFNKYLPYLLGALLDLLAKAMETHECVVLHSNPRMKDYHEWAASVAMALGYTQAQYECTLFEHIMARDNDVICQSELFMMIERILHDSGPINLSSGDLLKAVKCSSFANTGLPGSSNALTRELKKLAPFMRTVGFHIEHRRNGRHRFWTIGLPREIQRPVKDPHLHN